MGLPVVQGIELVPTSRLRTDQQRSLFNFPIFNAIQSQCFNTAYNTDNNLVVSAPTGSGKTVIMELAICRVLVELKAGRAKVIYQAPTKSLCSERASDWQRKFSCFGINCAELTGDTDFMNLRTVGHAAIIVTTPEKWDSITRKWKDNAKLIAMVRLFLVDEVHILKDARGATLEAIVSRMKFVGKDIRFIALSATVPNSNDIATWLGRTQTSPNLPAVREVFDDSFRPVKLVKHIVSLPGKNPWALESALTKKVPNIIAKHGKRKPVIVFCPTKESTSRTADALGQWYVDTPAGKRLWRVPGTTSLVQVESDHLHNLISQTGVAFHNSSLSPNDRHAVEKGFLDGYITVICSTSTLAVGVNLPCYLVILKGTVCYTENGLQEYSCMEVMQMLGLAGRPQFETEGAAVILCNENVKSRYERMIAGEEVLESSLHKNLIEHFNAEIGIGSITDKISAKQWLKGTFLHVRLQYNPEYYSTDRFGDTRRSTDEILENLCSSNLRLLQQAEMTTDKGSHIRCTEYGDAMARYCVRFETMKVFMAIPDHAKLPDMLEALAQAEEFKDYRLKPNEKPFYRELNKAHEIRYPIRGEIQHSWQKIYLLLQAKFGCTIFTKDKTGSGCVRQLLMDTCAVMTHAKRLVRCIIDIFVQKEDSKAVKAALELARCLAAGIWDDSTLQLKQVNGIGDVYTRKLAAADIKSIDQLADTTASKIEIALSKMPPFGLNLLRKAAEFPRLYVNAMQVEKRRRAGAVEVRIHCQIGFLNDRLPKTFNNRHYNIVFLCETDAKLVEFRRFSPQLLGDHQGGLHLTVKLDRPATIACHVMCDELVGTHTYAEFKPDIPNSWFLQCQSNCQKTMGLTTSSVATASQRSAAPKVDDFEMTDMDDADLLAREAAIESKIVEDIDDMFDEMDVTQGQDSSTDSRSFNGDHQDLALATRKETQQEQQDMLYVEDQKRKWALIDSDWLTYENYGHLVHITDN